MVVCCGVLFAVLLISGAAVAKDKDTQETFIIKKQASENMAGLSKDAIKERMGEAVRESMHALFDNASCVVQIQKVASQPVAETCLLHEKIIVLQRKLSKIAESLIENHFVYKKNHKKRLEASLALLRTCELEFKQTKEQLETPSGVTQEKVKEVTTKLAALETKLAADPCLKVV